MRDIEIQQQHLPLDTIDWNELIFDAQRCFTRSSSYQSSSSPFSLLCKAKISSMGCWIHWQNVQWCCTTIALHSIRWFILLFSMIWRRCEAMRYEAMMIGEFVVVRKDIFLHFWFRISSSFREHAFLFVFKSLYNWFLLFVGKVGDLISSGCVVLYVSHLYFCWF